MTGAAPQPGRRAGQVRLLGPPQWEDGAKPPLAFAPERRFQLLALLALRSGQWVARDELAAMLWPEHGSAEARRNLRHVVFKARETLNGYAPEANEHALRWTVATDVQRLQAALAERRAADAVALRHGPLLEGLEAGASREFADALQAERVRVDALWHQAALEQLAALAAQPALRSALAEQLLAVDPCDEAAVAALIEVDLAQGNAAGAEQHYRAFAARLAEQLGVEPSHRLRDLVRRASVTPATAAAPAAGPDAGFIGRRAELNELARLLAQTRLVTLVGPGGVGKSSLARQGLARIALPSTWIELQDLGDLDSVAARIAQRIGIELREGDDVVARLALALGPAPHLLALDNAEHLAELADFVARLLAAAPALVVLVTSRQPLGLDREVLLPLQGLALPDDESRDAEAATAFDAVRLFDARARAAQRGFQTARHIGAVIEIVEAVGGLPLAIELAASWVRLLPAEEIALDLRSTLDVLERDPGATGAPARPEHASVRAVLDRSWALLAPREREALEALAVFQGGFTRAAAAAVAGVALPLLSSLVDKSLVAVHEGGRFRAHPLIGADAARRLAAQPTREADLRDRHAGYWAATLAEALVRSSSDPRVIVGAVNEDYANACAAWAHAMATRRHDDLHRLTAVWRVVFDTQGRYGEGVRLLSAALELPLHDSASDRVAAVVRGALSMLQFRRHDLDQAIAVADAGITIAERCGERRALVACLFSAGSGHSIQGRWRLSQPMFERALAIAREDNERPEIAVALLNVGICAKKDGRADAALDLYSQSLALERELGRHVPAVRCLNNIGVLYMERGDWARTREFMAEGLRLCEQYGIASLAPYVETGLGQSLYELGQFEDAQRHLAHVLATVPAAELPVVHANVTVNLARVALRRRRFDEAREYFGAAARLVLDSEAQTDQLDFAMYWGEYLRDTGHRHDAARTWLMVIDHPLSEAGVRQGAQEGLDTLALDASALADARAEPLTLDALLAGLSAAFAPDKR